MVQRFSRRKVKIEGGDFEREKLNFGENLGIGRPGAGAVFGCPIDQQELEKVRLWKRRLAKRGQRGIQYIFWVV